MAYRRRRTFRRRPMRRARRAARSRNRMPMRSLVSRTTQPANVYKFVRSSWYQAPLASFTTDANGQKFGVIYARGINNIYTDFAVLTMPNGGEFTSLFDEYKILQFSLDIIPRFTSGEINSTGTANSVIPTIYWIHDTDDSSVPTTAAELMERPRVRYRVMNKPVRITCRYPCIADEVYNTVISTGYAPRKAPWLDVNSPSLAHFGIKFFVQGAALFDYTKIFDLKATWTFLVKNPR